MTRDLLAGSTGLEPAASGVTGRRYNHLNYDPVKLALIPVQVEVQKTTCHNAERGFFISE